MNTNTLIAPLENKKRILVTEKNSFLKKIDNEIDLAEKDIRDAVRELTGVSDSERTWIVGDVFITNFWSVPEVCLIKSIGNGEVSFIRLESIRNSKTLKKDFCSAGVEIELFLKIWKTFIHHSEWYAKYAQ